MEWKHYMLFLCSLKLHIGMCKKMKTVHNKKCYFYIEVTKSLSRLPKKSYRS